MQIPLLPFAVVDTLSNDKNKSQLLRHIQVLPNRHKEKKERKKFFTAGNCTESSPYIRVHLSTYRKRNLPSLNA